MFLSNTFFLALAAAVTATPQFSWPSFPGSGGGSTGGGFGGESNTANGVTDKVFCKGRSITRWLAKEGAKYIILASRSGPDQAGIAELVVELHLINVNVFVDRCDVADLSQVKSLVAKCQSTMPPVRSVIHGAMALRDALFETISHEDWNLNMKPRMQGAWNLHNALLNTNHHIDFFIMLASLSGLIGNPGQSVYAASNTFLDSFAAHRHSLGLPASTIDVGLVQSVGWVAQNVDKKPEIAAAAHDRLSEAELLAVIKAAIINPIPGCSFQRTATGLKLSPDKIVPGWATDPKFAHVLHAHQAPAAPDEQQSGTFSNNTTTRQLLKQASSVESAIHIVCEAIPQRLSSILMISAEDVDVKKPVVAYGFSLAAVELRNWINNSLEATVPLIELMNSATIELLTGKTVGKSRLVGLCLEGEEGKRGEVVVVEGKGEKAKVRDGGSHPHQALDLPRTASTMQFTPMISLILSLLSATTAAARAKTYPPLPCLGTCTNAHDPSLIRRSSDGTYFRFSTGGKIAVHIAPSIQGPWIYAGAALPNGSSIPKIGNQDLWAPDVTQVDTEYYLYYSVAVFGSQDSAIGVATSTTMDVGTWTDLGSTGVESAPGDKFNAIDGNLQFADDGKWYMNFGSFFTDLFQVEMTSPAPMTIVAQPVTSATPIAFVPTPPQAQEGAFGYRYGEYYYLFFSVGSCCGYDVAKPAKGEEYKIQVCRSASVAGPF
ncbi:MAG: hypothetical protein Q9208_007653, partial [Pyrenodesmia sp. 3 TL-2023]